MWCLGKMLPRKIELGDRDRESKDRLLRLRLEMGDRVDSER